MTGTAQCRAGTEPRPYDKKGTPIVNREKTDHDKTLLQRQIAATDKEIDRLVYDLYGLTEDEIAIVEQGTATKSPA